MSLNRYPWASVVIEGNGRKEFGTSLFYKPLNGMEISLSGRSREVLERLVEYIRLYDTWEWKVEGKGEAKHLNDLFYLEGPDAFLENRIDQIQSGGTEALWNEFEEQLLLVEGERIKRYLEVKEQAMIVVPNFFHDERGNPLTAGVVQADQYISELGNYLCENHPEIDFALMMKITENKVSFRTTKEGMDLTYLAKKYGDGGHKEAAGCKLSAIGKDFLGIVFDQIHAT